jgi:hypothetical protein
LKSEEATPRTAVPKLSNLVIGTPCPIRKKVRLRCASVSLRVDYISLNSKYDEASQLEDLSISCTRADDE